MLRYRGSYPEISNISNILVGNKIDHYSDVAGASLVGAAPTTSAFWTYHLVVVVVIVVAVAVAVAVAVVLFPNKTKYISI